MKWLARFRNLDRLTKTAVIVIAIGIFIRFALAAFSAPSGDSCWHLNIGRYIGQNLDIPIFEQLGRDVFARPPLFHIIVGAMYYFFSIFGYQAGDIAIKFVSPIFGSLTLVFSYLIAKMLFDKKIALYSSFFLSFFPLDIYFSSISHQESTITFFTVLAIYFLLKGRLILASVTTGLGMLTKYSGPFIVPVILFILCQKRVSIAGFFRKSFLFFLISFSVAMPWFIRNFVILGNPFWPMLRFIFPDGYYSSVAEDISATPQLLSLHKIMINLVSFYLGFFGVPEGNFKLFSLVNVPLFPLVLSIWFVSTIVFLVPFFIGLVRKNDHKAFLLCWIASFIAVVFVFSLFSGFYARLFLPALPAVAILWATGVPALPKNKLIAAVLIVIATGFVSAEAFKTYHAASLWNPYIEDFSWARDNSGQNDIFFAPGVCSAFYLNREVYLTDFEPRFYGLFNASNLREHNVKFVFANTLFIPAMESRFPEMLMPILNPSEDFKLLYANKATGTEIYRVS